MREELGSRGERWLGYDMREELGQQRREMARL
jgi:hypothetical protein